MLDIKYVRENLEETKKRLAARQMDVEYLNVIPELDEKRRETLQKVEELKNKRNTTSKLIGQYKREGKDTAEIMETVAGIGDEIKTLDAIVIEIDAELKNLLLKTPNIPYEDVPVGTEEADNVEIRRIGTPTEFNFEPQAHWDLVENLGLVDFERAAKITGSRFAVYKNLGARLERALISFMLDLHTGDHGYEEILPPVIVNSESLVGTGQLPKFEEDLFKLRGEKDYYLIPTAEVPVTNLHREEILENEQLPIKYTAYSSCFRSEAGSAGRDTRGLIRQHQFNKVELVQFVRPEESEQALEMLTNQAERVLQLLKLPYRVLSLCTADLGFSSQKTYDLEVWLPSYNEYKEISSCSNFGDFQARRAQIRFRRDSKSKPEFVHTLNGSGLAIGRTVAAIIENYQNADGTITIPEVLVPYMGGKTVIK
ncbi:MAG: serine--tRNA ligase [Culicoidibacterales bacterium]